MIYEHGPVNTDDLRVGDVINIEWARLWGPLVRFYPYVPGVPDYPLDTTGWRVAVFASGAEATVTPGGTWFPE
jgi:hypothetical protein